MIYQNFSFAYADWASQNIILADII